MRRLLGLALGYLLSISPLATAGEKLALPDGAVARLGEHRLRVPNAIRDAQFTPDGRTFLVVILAGKSQEPTFVYFDVATGLERERKRLPVRKAGYVCLAERKPLVAFSTEEGFEVWDLAAEKLVQRWAEPKWAAETRVLALSPDGAHLAAAAGARDQRVLLQWDVATGKRLPPRGSADGHICALSFSGDGSKLFSASTEAIRRIDDKYVTIPGAITTFDARSGKKLAELKNTMSYVVFSPDGARAARRHTDKREIIDIATGQRLADFAARVDDQFVFTPDSKQLLMISGGDARLWDIAAKKDALVFEDAAWSRSVLRFSRDGKRVAIIEGDAGAHVVTFRDMKTGKRMPIDAGHPTDVLGLAYAPDGRRLATFSSNVLSIFDVKTGAELRRWIAHEKYITQIAFSPDGKLLASADAAGAIALWDADTAKERRRFQAKEYISSLVFTEGGAALLAAGSNRALQGWDVASGKLRQSRAAPVKLSSIAPTGQFLAGFVGDDGQRRAVLHHVNARTSAILAPIKLHSPAPKDDDFPDREEKRALVFSPDGKLIATSDTYWGRRRGAVHVWESATGREIFRWIGDANNTALLALSPDGRTLAHGFDPIFRWAIHGGDQTIVLRDLSAGSSDAPEEMPKADRLIGGHLGRITCVTFSPDGKFLATGGTDRVVYIWPVEPFVKRARPAELKVNVAEFGSDAGKDYRAIAHLAQKPKEALALVRLHLKPVPRADAKIVAQQVRDLGSQNFAIRRRAQAALEQLGDQAAHLLIDALQHSSDLEVKRRLDELLTRLDRPFEDPAQLRAYRCLILLERIGTAESREFLEELAQGAPAAWLTIEARRSLERHARK